MKNVEDWCVEVATRYNGEEINEVVIGFYGSWLLANGELLEASKTETEWRQLERGVHETMREVYRLKEQQNTALVNYHEKTKTLQNECVKLEKKIDYLYKPLPKDKFIEAFKESLSEDVKKFITNFYFFMTTDDDNHKYVDMKRKSLAKILTPKEVREIDEFPCELETMEENIVKQYCTGIKSDIFTASSVSLDYDSEKREYYICEYYRIPVEGLQLKDARKAAKKIHI